MMAYVNFICVYITKVHDDYVLPPFSTETVKSGLEMVQVYLNQKSHGSTLTQDLQYLDKSNPKLKFNPKCKKSSKLQRNQMNQNHWNNASKLLYIKNNTSLNKTWKNQQKKSLLKYKKNINKEQTLQQNNQFTKQQCNNGNIINKQNIQLQKINYKIIEDEVQECSQQPQQYFQQNQSVSVQKQNQNNISLQIQNCKQKYNQNIPEQIYNFVTSSSNKQEVIKFQYHIFIRLMRHLRRIQINNWSKRRNQ
ncbi:Hypothetical_protein [Hexamita inflata]|uniref:Hypothetical_protein n=1 Tax=Hexamita inflata TaxID=28002 RepID=A0AA86R704_9EUKA|nr:Hypothetical protein HINF_LOCUS57523 [Hexamita inflata]